MASSTLPDDILAHLHRTPRELPSRYLYDDLGSALFDAICELPWYPITRAEQSLLRTHGSAIAAAAGGATTWIELGPGNGSKLDTLVEQAPQPPRSLHLVDLSSAALGVARERLARRPGVSITLHHADYLAGLAVAISGSSSDGARMVLFLGSNIGNFDALDAAALLAAIRSKLQPGDSLLLGADLVKSVPEMLLAYDDPLGVTAAFNRNILVRLNHDFATGFDLTHYQHEARWNAAESQIEMWLVSRVAQRVRIPGLKKELQLTEGEAIRTERSRKYQPEEIAALLQTAGFTVVQQWMTDGFSETMARVDGPAH
ncbi:MAG TPA: L-histidine N(alpha)-methyltransferase [Gemmatimonadales bacterium]|jgi:dimethylhistidine N-methyltransferase